MHLTLLLILLAHLCHLFASSPDILFHDESIGPVSSTFTTLGESGDGERLIRSRKNTPAWCLQLARVPRPFLPSPSCNVHGRLSDVDNVKCGRFFSQYGQDVWVWWKIAQFMSRPGIYVDIGAHSPAFISNTYFLDRCLGWTGFCIEGQSRYHKDLNRFRSCKVFGCASDRDEEIGFVQAGDLGGIAQYNKNVNGTMKWQRRAKTARVVKTRCRPVGDILKENSINVVDYMSVDVEGAELKVLKGVRFDQVSVRVISVEGHGPSVREYLKQWGYRSVCLKGDCMFVRELSMNTGDTANKTSG